MHWAEDHYWTEALERYNAARQRGETTIALDLSAIEKVAFDGDGPVYRLMEAMSSVQECEGEDDYRVLSRYGRQAEFSRRCVAALQLGRTCPAKA